MKVGNIIVSLLFVFLLYHFTCKCRVEGLIKAEIEPPPTPTPTRGRLLGKWYDDLDCDLLGFDCPKTTPLGGECFIHQDDCAPGTHCAWENNDRLSLKQICVTDT